MSEDRDQPKPAAALEALPHELKKAKWLLSASCQAVFEALAAGGYEGRAVGGSVRNALLGIPVADVDIATPALPDVVADLAKQAGLGVHETGIDHGTLTVVSSHVPYEVTTLRRDVSTDGRRATVAFTDDWAEDASRRDFTINALYCDRHGVLHDPLGGLPDIANRKVRFIGSADQRIREDFLRILRFFRFFAVFGEGDIDPIGLAACVSEKHGLGQLSGERIHAELMKLLVAPRAVEALHIMNETQILDAALKQHANIPVLDRLIELERHLKIAPHSIRRLAALINQESDRVEEVAGKLRLSNVERKRLKNACRGNAREYRLDSSSAKEALFRRGPEAYLDDSLISWARSTDEISDPKWFEVLRLAKEWPVPENPIKGADILKMGVPAGPKIGAVLEEFTAWWIANDFLADDKIITAKLRSLVADVLRQEK